MLERIESPENVLAFRAAATSTRSTTRSARACSPRDARRPGEVRFVYVLGDQFEGYTAAATWEDTKLGFGHLHKWKRCAVVTNHDWVRHLIGVFAWMMSGEIKVFDVTDEAAAIAWAAEG